jgi:hypothetical protein
MTRNCMTRPATAGALYKAGAACSRLGVAP